MGAGSQHFPDWTVWECDRRVRQGNIVIFAINILVADLLGRLRVSLPTSLSAAASSVVAGIPEQIFLDLQISPKCVSGGEGHLLTFNGLTVLGFASVDRKSLYHIFCKSLFFKQLASHPDTKWREHGQFLPDISPTWRLLYKPELWTRFTCLGLESDLSHEFDDFRLDLMKSKKIWNSTWTLTSVTAFTCRSIIG